MSWLTHDDIQLWLNNWEHQDVILMQLFGGHFYLENIAPGYSDDGPIGVKIEKEIRIEHDCFSESFPDMLTTIHDKKILWEIKTILNDLGGTLRQIKRYQNLTHPTWTILVYNTAKLRIEEIEDYFSSENILVFQITPSFIKNEEVSEAWYKTESVKLLAEMAEENLALKKMGLL